MSQGSEVWKTVQAFPAYEVSNHGRLKRKADSSPIQKVYKDRKGRSYKCRYKRKVKEKILKPIQGKYYELWRGKVPHRKRADTLALDHHGVRLNLPIQLKIGFDSSK